MADELVITPQNQNPEIPAELKEQMNIALNLKNPQPTPPAAAAQSDAPAHSSEPTAVIVPFEFKTLTERFGYQTPEDAFKEIEELRVLKSTPPATVAPEIKFENETSEKIFKAIQSGNIKEVTNILAQQDRLDNLTTAEVTKDSAADIIKLGLQIEHPTLTAEEIDYEYRRNYNIPKEPVQKTDEEPEEFEERKALWGEQVKDIEMRRMIDAKKAIPKLQSAKSQIKLPEIPNQVNDEFVQWQKLMNEQADLDKEIKEQYKNLSTKDVEIKLPYKDDANKVDFEFQLEPDAEIFKQTLELAQDPDGFLKTFVSNGKFDKGEYLKAIYFAKNWKTILNQAINQSKNATLKGNLPDNSGSSGLSRQPVVTHEPSELQKQMAAALNGYQPATRN